MQIYSKRVGNQPHSVSLNLSFNSLSLFLSFRLTAIKLGNGFPRIARRNKLQEPTCLRCNSNVLLQTVASRDGCFLWDWVASVWASSYPLQLSVAPTFPLGGVKGGGGREAGNPLLSRTLSIITLEITSREQDRNTLSADTAPPPPPAPAPHPLCVPGVIRLVVTPAETPLAVISLSCQWSCLHVEAMWRHLCRRKWRKNAAFFHTRMEIKLSVNTAQHRLRFNFIKNNASFETWHEIKATVY